MNWQFWTSAGLTFAGILTAIYLWQADPPRQLAVRQVAQDSLEPELKGAKSKLSVLLDGSPLTTPYLTVLELRNTGRRPITVPDFEGPIAFTVESPVRIVRSDVTSSTPKNLDPVMVTASNAVTFKPLLLNPGDALTFVAITADGVPTFALRVRIAGVSNPSIEDATKLTKGPSWGWVAYGSGVSFAVVFFLISLVPPVEGYTLYPVLTTNIIAKIAMLAGSAQFSLFLVFGEQSVGLTLAIEVLALVVAALVGRTINSKFLPRSQPT